MGGVSRLDSWETLLPSSAAADGRFQCMYPGGLDSSVAGPIYPLVTSPIAVIVRPGPLFWNSPNSRTDACANGFATHNLTDPTVGTRLLLDAGLLSWLVMATGALSILRRVRGSPTHWDLVALGVLAVAPPVTMSFTQYFHPECVLALGFVLWAISAMCATSFRWAGALLAAAVLTQQSTILFAVAVLLLSRRRSFRALIEGAAVVTAAILVPLGVVTSGRILTDLSGKGFTVQSFNTWISETHLSGNALVVVSRITPIVLVGIVTVVLRRRRIHDTQIASIAEMLLVLAVAGVARTLFEVNLYSYYLMTFAVAQVIRDFVLGKLRVRVLGWFAVASVLFPPWTWWPQLDLSTLPVWVPQAIVVGIAGLLVLESSATNVGPKSTISPESAETSTS